MAVDQTAVLGSHLAVAVGQMVGFGQVAVVADQIADLGNHLVAAVDQTAVLGSHLAAAVGQMVGFGQVAVVVDQIADLGNHLVAAVGQMVDFELVVVIDQTVVLGNHLAVVVGQTVVLGNRLVAVAFHSSSLDCKTVDQTADLGSFADQIADRMNSQPFQA